MYKIGFNDCIPKNGSPATLIGCMEKSLREYRTIKEKFTESIEGIIIQTVHSNILLNNHSYTLDNCLSDLGRDYKTLGYRVFTKYPIENYYSIDEKTIENNYTIEIDAEKYNAFHPKIVADNNGILFTLAIHNDLKKDTLTIANINDDIVEVVNLFGEIANTNFICNLLFEIKHKQLDNFNQLLSVLGNHVFSPRFQKNFEGLNTQVQFSIIEHFKKAINRNGSTKLFADGDLIKDVTPQKEIKIKIYELRIFSPIAIRRRFNNLTQR